jgi:translation initiation factor 2 subunit 2
MTNPDYKNLLKKVIDSTPKKEVAEDRFKLPKADIFYEGNTTVIKNFDKITDIINREPDIVLKFLLGNLGTAGELVGPRAVFQGKIPTKNIHDKIKDYVDMFVICSECSRPDTHLVKKGRELLIRCDACGAFRSVKSRKKKVVSLPSSESLKEGATLELTIKDIGKKGDGIAYHDKYIIYVAGAIKGTSVKVKIEKISGTVAFGHIVQV